MKIGRESSEVEIGNAESKPRAFQIAASRSAFDILSSGLYNNQIGAIIRELSCNAYDAHVAAGKANVPFDIHLPTRFEPFFSVEDFGIGMSEEQVYSLYTTYFGSDKADSNDFVGALGLGSKSPFSYTEGFTVVSKYNGVKTTYTCFINENGTPDVQKQMSMIHLDEEEPLFAQSMNNGVRVSFPVKITDIQEFMNNAAKMLEFFDPLPNFNEKVTVEKANYVMRTDRWGLRKEDRYDYSKKGVRAVQGFVKYSIGTIDKSKLSWDEQQLLEQPLDLFFSIGDLSVAASRETLKNDERTIRNILTAIQQVAASYAEEIKKQFGQCKTRWEAIIFLKKLFDSYSPMSRLLRSQYDKGQFDGEYSFGSIKHDEGLVVKTNEFDYMPVTVNCFTSVSHSRHVDAEKSRTFIDHAIREDRLRRIKEGKEEKSYYTWKHEPAANEIFVIGDIAFGAEKFIHHFLQRAIDNRPRAEGRITRVYLISRATKEISVEVVVKNALKMLKELGDPPYQLLSSLKTKYWPELKTEKEIVNRGIVAFDLNSYISEYGGGGYERKGWREGWSITFEIDQTTGKYMIPKGEKKYYLKLKKGEPVDLHFDNAEKFRQFVVNVIESGQFTSLPKKLQLYGMAENSQLLKEAEADPAEWVEFSKDVWDQLLKIITPELEMKLSLQVKGFRCDSLEDAFQDLSRNLDPNSPMKVFIDELGAAKSIDVKKAGALAKVIAEASRHKICELKHITDFEAEWEKLMKLYPLLERVHYDRYSNAKETKESIIEYVQMKDEKRKFEELILEGDKNTQLYLEAQQLENEETNAAQEETPTVNQEVTAKYPATVCVEAEEVHPSNAL